MISLLDSVGWIPRIEKQSLRVIGGAYAASVLEIKPTMWGTLQRPSHRASELGTPIQPIVGGRGRKNFARSRRLFICVR